MDEQLVQKVVVEVLTRLRRGEGPRSSVADPRPTRGGELPAARPPGAFPKGQSSARGLDGDSDRAGPGKTFITAEALARRLAGGGKGGVIELAANEFLTPGAADLADQRHVTVKRAARGCASAARGQPVMLDAERPGAQKSSGEPLALAPLPGGEGGKGMLGRCSPVGLVVDRGNETVRAMLAGLGREAADLADFNLTDCWMRNVQAVGRAIHDRAAAAGVVITPAAADAVLLANKINGVRAIQGVGGPSLAAVLARTAANLLVLEPAASTLHEMRSMIRRFVRQVEHQTAGDRTLLGVVEQLERS